jgi:hypothetical protein
MKPATTRFPLRNRHYATARESATAFALHRSVLYLLIAAAAIDLLLA